MNEVKMLEAVKILYDAWYEPGNHPNYHYTILRNLERDWPILTDAIQGIFKAIE